MSKIQFNSKNFAATRKILNAYFGAKYDLAIELDKARKNTSAVSKVIATDREQLSALALGNSEGITRTMDEIRESLKVNVATYSKAMARYNTLYTESESALKAGVELFANKDSALYKAYKAYVESLSEESYVIYATELSKRFVALGLTDATAENVVPFMVNVDRELRGKSAVKNNSLQSASAPKAFAEALLRKIYVDNKSIFASKKFANYVRKCAEKASK